MRRALLLLVVAVISFGAGRASASPSVNDHGIKQLAFKLPNGRGVALEVATDNGQGLKGRRLRGGRGMLFIHPIGPPPIFTMAGVPAALGILHLGDDGELLAKRVMRYCRWDDWKRCPTYPAPTGSELSIELRPELLAGLKRGDRILNRAAVDLLVR